MFYLLISFYETLMPNLLSSCNLTLIHNWFISFNETLMHILVLKNKCFMFNIATIENNKHVWIWCLFKYSVSLYFTLANMYQHFTFSSNDVMVKPLVMSVPPPYMSTSWLCFL